MEQILAYRMRKYASDSEGYRFESSLTSFWNSLFELSDHLGPTLERKYAKPPKYGDTVLDQLVISLSEFPLDMALVQNYLHERKCCMLLILKGKKGLARIKRGFVGLRIRLRGRYPYLSKTEILPSIHWSKHVEICKFL
jgi:hypothetical protein